MLGEFYQPAAQLMDEWVKNSRPQAADRLAGGPLQNDRRRLAL